MGPRRHSRPMRAVKRVHSSARPWDSTPAEPQGEGGRGSPRLCVWGGAHSRSTRGTVRTEPGAVSGPVPDSDLYQRPVPAPGQLDPKAA